MLRELNQVVILRQLKNLQRAEGPFVVSSNSELSVLLKERARTILPMTVEYWGTSGTSRDLVEERGHTVTIIAQQLGDRTDAGLPETVPSGRWNVHCSVARTPRRRVAERATRGFLEDPARCNSIPANPRHPSRYLARV